MALIKCKECGQMISDKAMKCPKCGSPIIKESVAQDNVNIEQQIVYDNVDNVGKMNKWLYAVIALLLAAIAGGGYYFYDKNKQVERDNQQEHLNDSTTDIAETTSYNNEIANNRLGIKVEGYKVTGNRDDLNFKLCVNVDGRIVKEDYDGLAVVEILDEHDYDGNGTNECLLLTDMGGSAAPTMYSIVFFNSVTKEMDAVRFDEGYLRPIPVTQNGKWYFVVKDGINTQKFVFDNTKLKKISDKDKKTSKSLKSYSFVNIFGMKELDKQEKTIRQYYDMNDDGVLEALDFHSNQSHAWDYGKSMSLTIKWDDNEQTVIGMTTKKISIISSKSNGIYDLLFEDKYLFKWNGKEYVETQ